MMDIYQKEHLLIQLKRISAVTPNVVNQLFSHRLLTVAQQTDISLQQAQNELKNDINVNFIDELICERCYTRLDNNTCLQRVELPLNSISSKNSHTDGFISMSAITSIRSSPILFNSQAKKLTPIKNKTPLKLTPSQLIEQKKHNSIIYIHCLVCGFDFIISNEKKSNEYFNRNLINNSNVYRRLINQYFNTYQSQNQEKKIVIEPLKTQSKNNQSEYTFPISSNPLSSLFDSFGVEISAISYSNSQAVNSPINQSTIIRQYKESCQSNEIDLQQYISKYPSPSEYNNSQIQTSIPLLQSNNNSLPQFTIQPEMESNISQENKQISEIINGSNTQITNECLKSLPTETLAQLSNLSADQISDVFTPQFMQKLQQQQILIQSQPNQIYSQGQNLDEENQIIKDNKQPITQSMKKNNKKNYFSNELRIEQSSLHNEDFSLSKPIKRNRQQDEREKLIITLKNDQQNEKFLDDNQNNQKTNSNWNEHVTDSGIKRKRLQNSILDDSQQQLTLNNQKNESSISINQRFSFVSAILDNKQDQIPTSSSQQILNANFNSNNKQDNIGDSKIFSVDPTSWIFDVEKQINQTLNKDQNKKKRKRKRKSKGKRSPDNFS